MPIGETFLIIAGVVPIIIFSSSSIDDLFPCSLIFLEEYDALLNELCCCCCYSWTSLNLIVLIIENERNNN